MPSDIISCILHDAEMIRVASRSMTRTFQSLRSFCRTESQRNISLINSIQSKCLVQREQGGDEEIFLLAPTSFCRLDVAILFSGMKKKME